MHIALTIYLAGVVLGLVVMRDAWPARLATALVWPLGPIAFVIVVAIMLVTAAILWPVTILGSAAVLAAVIYLTAC
jgi:hypothetical protein